MTEIDPHYDRREFNFPNYKKLLCTAYQTSNFNQALVAGKSAYLGEFDDDLPYPIQSYPEEYELFSRFLERQIQDRDLQALELMSKTEAKSQYHLNDNFFTLFYSHPEEIVEMQNSRERFGKSQIYAHLYNRNKIISIMESEKYLEYKQNKKNNKKNLLNF